MGRLFHIFVTMTTCFTVSACVPADDSKTIANANKSLEQTKAELNPENTKKRLENSDLVDSVINKNKQSPKNKLYKISSENGDSYVLGTIHFGVGIDEFKTKIEVLIKGARIVLPEIDYTSEQLELYKTDPFKIIFQTSPLSETSDLDDATVAKLIDLGFPRYMAERLNDNSCMALQTLLMARPGQVSLDLQVIEVAHKSNLKVRALDSLELRQQARTSNDRKEGSCSLRQLVNTYTKDQILDSLNSSLVESVKSYKNGDITDAQQFDIPIVTVRNHEWIKAIANEVQQGRAFISVGDGHLQGKNGVLQLLKDQGFRVDLVE